MHVYDRDDRDEYGDRDGDCDDRLMVTVEMVMMIERLYLSI